MTATRQPTSQAGGPILRSFAEVVLAAGYDSPVVHRLVRIGRLLRPEAIAPPADPELGPLAELLAVGRAVPRAVAERALAPLALNDLVQAGLLEVDRGDVRSPFRAETVDGLLLLGDDVRASRADLVAALYGPSILLSRLTPRTPRRSMLDLGSGSGVQALLGARHCERVVAVDVNPHAVELGRMNAGLNGADNVEWRRGSWFEAAPTERFDLITCNPPYVISPDAEFAYRDSGMAPGALIEQLCQELPAHLEDGGLGIVLGMWPHAEGEDWDRVPGRWLAESGCDGFVVCLDTSDPLEQAVRWNSPPAVHLDPAEHFETVERWQRFYAEHGIGAVSFGAVVLRRRGDRDREPWSLLARGAAAPGKAAARQLELMIAGNDLLRQDADLLSRRYAVPDGLSITQRFLRRDGRWAGRMAVARLAGGLGVSGDVDPDALPAVFRCTGADTLRDVLGETEPALAEAAVRTLLSHGLLAAQDAEFLTTYGLNQSDTGIDLAKKG